MPTLETYVNGLPNICGSEKELHKITNRHAAVYGNSGIAFDKIKAACAVALHMQQPLIPAGSDHLESAEIISNLKHMMDNQGMGDNHNAPVFYQCYKRVGELVPQLVSEGKEPRVMLEYTGCLFHGLKNMGSDDLFEALTRVTVDPTYQRCVEWLGCPWGHAVAPSTPPLDFRLHVTAWQHMFAAIFGTDALARVRGFSPSEMALPNHPDVAYEFVKTLKDTGHQWVIIQEHTVEQLNGHALDRQHLPHRLVVTNAAGETESIIALIKTQGSDTKLVAQMQPYYEACSLDRWELDGISVPPLVTQIADGENGGVMMNEFPPKFLEVARNSANSDVVMMNGTEYLEYLFASGVKESSLPEIQPIHQAKIWDRVVPGCGSAELNKAIDQLKGEDHEFHMEGGSWTSDISWVKGYENLTGPMEEASALFHEKIIVPGIPTSDPRFQQALFHLMCAQTSCFRYWGQGTWTDYGRELCRRTMDVLRKEF